MDDLRLEVRFFKAPADLGPCFTTFYRLTVTLPEGVTVTDQLHPEWANLRFFTGPGPETMPALGPKLDRTRFTATGPSSRPIGFAIGATRMWGIGLLPLGWARYVGVPAHEHADRAVDGEASPVFRAFSSLARVLCSGAGDDDSDFAAAVAWFRSHAVVTPDDAKICAIHEALVDPDVVEVSELSERAGLGKRTLERACLKHFGFPPQMLLRRQRLMRSLAGYMVGPADTWTNAIDCHYHDQAHFVREFQAFMGCTPGDYARRPHPVLAAFMAERQRIMGSAVHTLDVPSVPIA